MLSNVVLQKILENPLDCKELKPVNSKGNQPWIFIGRTDAEAKAPILWPPDGESWLTGKTLMLGKTEGRRGRGWQRMWWLDGITNSMYMGLGRLGSWLWTGRPDVLRFVGLQRVGHDWATELNWLSALSFWVCFPELVTTTDLLNEGKAQFDSLPDKLQGMPAVSHCFRELLIPWN